MRPSAGSGTGGPGEAELANPMFADDPAMLLMAAAEVADNQPQPRRRSTLARRLADNARGLRELAHDTTLRFTHELRMTLRELGSRGWRRT